MLYHKVKRKKTMEEQTTALPDTNYEAKFKQYMDSVKRAQKKYIERHRAELNAKCRAYYHTRCVANEEYKAKKREYNRLLYQRKKNAQGSHTRLGLSEPALGGPAFSPDGAYRTAFAVRTSLPLDSKKMTKVEEPSLV